MLIDLNSMKTLFTSVDDETINDVFGERTQRTLTWVSYHRANEIRATFKGRIGEMRISDLNFPRAMVLAESSDMLMIIHEPDNNWGPVRKDIAVCCNNIVPTLLVGERPQTFYTRASKWIEMH